MIRTNINRLDVLPLEPAGSAVGRESPLYRADSGDRIARRSQRPVARRAGFLIVDAEIRVVRKKIKLVTETLDDCAGQIAWIRQRVIMERFVNERKRTILRLERRQMDLGIVETCKREPVNKDLCNGLLRTRSSHVSENTKAPRFVKRCRQNALN